MLTTAYLYVVLLQVLLVRTVVFVPATLVEISLHEKRAVLPVTFSDFLAGVVVDAPSLVSSSTHRLLKASSENHAIC
jgi:hypothetical protein